MNQNKIKVPLTASHSSTVAEECILLIRTLHMLPQWNYAVNLLLVNELYIAGEMLTDGALFNYQVCILKLDNP